MKSCANYYGVFGLLCHLSNQNSNFYFDELGRFKKANVNNESLIVNNSIALEKKILPKKVLYYLYAVEKELTKFYSKAESLILKLFETFPFLYHKVESINDAERNQTHVYMTVVQRFSVPYNAQATTTMNCVLDNPNVYNSDYGPKTVFVKLVDNKRALSNLVHEFACFSSTKP